MANKTLNQLSDEMTKENKLTDEHLDFFREIDVMNSVGMMSWLTKTCKEVLEKLDKGEVIVYKEEELDRAGFLGVLNETISDLLMRRILDV